MKERVIALGMFRTYPRIGKSMKRYKEPFIFTLLLKAKWLKTGS